MNSDQPMTEKAKHPAKFSPEIMTALRQILDMTLEHNPQRSPFVILDPFAGTGRIHELDNFRNRALTWGIEIEPEWQSQHHMTVLGDSRTHMHAPIVKRVDMFMTSPCYGNRMADHHEARDPSKRNTYRHTLGRPLTPGNAGMLQWGDEYRKLHLDVYTHMTNVYRREGVPTWFVLNMSDHIRKGERVRVVEWHADALSVLGWNWDQGYKIPTRRQRQGENGDVRVDYEEIVVLRYDD